MSRFFSVFSIAVAFTLVGIPQRSTIAQGLSPESALKKVDKIASRPNSKAVAKLAASTDSDDQKNNSEVKDEKQTKEKSNLAVIVVESVDDEGTEAAEAVKSDPDSKKSVLSDSAAIRQRMRAARKKRFAYLKPQIESNLKFYFNQRERSESRSPWGVMHAMVAFGPYAEMYGNGRLMKDVDWLCQNGKCRGMQLMTLRLGQLDMNNGPGRQGHDGQFLAILAQSQIPETRKLHVARSTFSIEDLVRYEMRTCKTGTELTFKLIGLSHYLDSDSTWRTPDGQAWSLERIVEEELKQPINGVACGGTHRLMGYSYSLLMRKIQGKPIDGHWKRADVFVRDFREYAFRLQNRDGSFSTEWFKRRAARNDPQRRVQTTGHILEWLVFSATDEQLEDPRLVRAVEYLSDLMGSQRSTKWEVGPKGHAVRALRLFYERVLADSVAVADAIDRPYDSNTKQR